jgi:hypothetical protein
MDPAIHLYNQFAGWAAEIQYEWRDGVLVAKT